MLLQGTQKLKSNDERANIFITRVLNMEELKEYCGGREAQIFKFGERHKTTYLQSKYILRQQRKVRETQSKTHHN